jgi:hypothetical protein
MKDKEWKKITRDMQIIRNNLYTLNDPKIEQKTKDHIIYLIKEREIARSKKTKYKC